MMHTHVHVYNVNDQVIFVSDVLSGVHRLVHVRSTGPHEAFTVVAGVYCYSLHLYIRHRQVQRGNYFRVSFQVYVTIVYSALNYKHKHTCSETEMYM